MKTGINPNPGAKNTSDGPYNSTPFQSFASVPLKRKNSLGSTTSDVTEFTMKSTATNGQSVKSQENNAPQAKPSGLTNPSSGLMNAQTTGVSGFKNKEFAKDDNFFPPNNFLNDNGAPSSVFGQGAFVPYNSKSFGSTTMQYKTSRGFLEEQSKENIFGKSTAFGTGESTLFKSVVGKGQSDLTLREVEGTLTHSKMVQGAGFNRFASNQRSASEKPVIGTPNKQTSLHTQGAETGGLKKMLELGNATLPFPTEIFNYDDDFLTEDTMFLISEEETNIASFRENIEKEKSHMTNDMDLLIKEVINIMEESKIRLVEAIDEHYKLYIHKYKVFKDEIINFKNAKKELLKQKSPSFSLNETTSSNSNLLKELQEIRQHNQLTKLFQYYSAMMKEQQENILSLSKQILQLSAQVQKYYNTETFGNFVKEVKTTLNLTLKKRLADTSDIVRPLPDFENKFKPGPLPVNAGNSAINIVENRLQTNAHGFLENQRNNFNSSFTQEINFKQNINMEDFIRMPLESSSSMNLLNRPENLIIHNKKSQDFGPGPNPYPLQTPPNQQNRGRVENVYNNQNATQINQTRTTEVTMGNDFVGHQYASLSSQQNASASQSRMKNMYSAPYTLEANGAPQQSTSKSSHSPRNFNKNAMEIISEQPISTFNLSGDRMTCKVAFNNPNAALGIDLDCIVSTEHKDIILCLAAVDEDTIATGSKDHSVHLYSLKRKGRVGSLIGHTGSICSLGVFTDLDGRGNNMLLSGSDHGDSSIILWDVGRRSMIKKLTGHSAAVVALLPIAGTDGSLRNLISASYDKEIFIWNVPSGRTAQKLSGHASSICSLCLSRDKQRFASAALDNQINIWKINYKKDKEIENVFMEKSLKNNTPIYSLNMIGAKTLVTGCKDGKIKFWNIESGEIERVLTANVNPIIEVLVLEAQDDNFAKSSNSNQLISLTFKDKNIIVTNSRTGVNSMVDLQGHMMVEYGCGVNPKANFMVVGEELKFIVVNQSEKEKMFSVWDIRV